MFSAIAISPAQPPSSVFVEAAVFFVIRECHDPASLAARADALVDGVKQELNCSRLSTLLASHFTSTVGFTAPYNFILTPSTSTRCIAHLMCCQIKATRIDPSIDPRLLVEASLNTAWRPSQLWGGPRRLMRSLEQTSSHSISS